MKRFLFPLLVCIAGVALLFVRSDREFINLRPTEGAVNSVFLEANSIYTQQFIAHSTSMTRLGLYLAPTTNTIPNAPVYIRILRDSEVLASSDIPAVFIDGDRPTEIVFDPALALEAEDIVAVELRVPEELSRRIRAQQRVHDESFNAADAMFSVNGEPQENPLAYQAHFSYTPSFSLQLGSLLLVIGMVWAAVRFFSISLEQHWNIRFALLLAVYSISLAVIFSLPHIALGGSASLLLIVSAALALFGMTLLLLQYHTSVLAALFGAHIFAFTTWFPLHIIAGRASYAVIALLPLLIFFINKFPKHNMRRISLILFAFLLILISFVTEREFLDTQPAQIKDVFLDPNQIPSSQKIYPTLEVASEDLSEAWDNYGSYTGVAAIVFALVGIASRGRANYVLTLLMLLIGFIVFYPPATSLVSRTLPITPQHLSVGVTLILSIFASLGFASMQTFLGRRDRFVTSLLIMMMLIALLDMWHVATGPLEFGLL